MLKVLFSVFCKNDSHIYIIRGIVDMLFSKGYRIDVISNKDLNLEVPMITDYENTSIVNYDIIIAFNRKGYNNIKKQKKAITPLVYALCSSDIESEYMYEPNLFDRILLINDERNIYSKFFPQDFTTQIGIPFNLINKAITYKKNYNILVRVDQSTLFKIIPILNNIYQFNFIVITESPLKFKKIVNSNIILVKSTDEKISYYLTTSSLVIGNGVFILDSLQYNKPSIVVGKYGLGRYIQYDNFKQQYITGFQGRNGAEIGEYIPQKLLSYEISRLIEITNSLDCNFKRLKKTINEQYSLTSSKIDKLMISICSKNENIWSTLYRLCETYKYIENKNNKYFIIDKRFNKIFSTIGYEEYEIIKTFDSIITPIDVYKIRGCSDKTDFIDFIRQLISNKIIIKYEG